MTLLLGPPGSGKTTLLLALAGRLDKDLKVVKTDLYSSFIIQIHQHLFCSQPVHKNGQQPRNRACLVEILSLTNVMKHHRLQAK
jgi:ABC-type multidrug transport system ATPase subunit